MTTPRAAPPVRPREIFGWAMFDFANSSYVTIIVTVAFSVFFTEAVAPAGEGDRLWGLGITVSNVIVMALASIVGAVADGAAKKKLFLGIAWIVCVAGTAGLALVDPGEVALALTLFVISNIAFAFGENLAGAFLPELSTPKTIGRISGFGWGLGYVGGLLSLFAVRPLMGGGFGADNVADLKTAWLLTAGFFFVAGLPTFLFLRERAIPSPETSWAGHAREGITRILETAREIRLFKDLVRFLGVFFFYQAGLTAIIAFAGIYAVRTIGFSSADLIVLFLVLNVAAAVGALLFGLIQDRLGAKRTVLVTLVLWLAICTGAYLVTTKAGFWWVGVGAGIGIGSLQSASRALMGLFSPVEKSGEFFGFWGLAAKAAGAVGPLVFGMMSSGFGDQRPAILATGAFFLVGLVGMVFLVDEARGRWGAEAWDRRERREDLAGAAPSS